MNTAWSNEKPAIAWLRVKSDGLDPLTAQLRAYRLLMSCEFRADALPPSAILCIRKLGDPLPGKLPMHHALAVRPPVEWQRALTGSLDALAQSAVRPWLAPVPVLAPAVVFMDHAELLACLAVDWLRGEMAQHWWWRRVLREIGGLPNSHSARVLAAWEEAPECIPAALALLDQKRQAVEFVRRLDEKTALAWAKRIARAYGMTEMYTQIASFREAAAPAPSRTNVSGSQPPPASPWRASHWGQATLQGQLFDLPVHELLLGMALALHHAPARARSGASARQTGAWLASIVAQPSGPHDLPDESPVTAPGASDRPATTAVVPQAPPDRTHPALPPLSGPQAQDAGARQETAPDSLPQVRAPGALFPERTGVPGPVRNPETPEPALAVMRSQFGGIFYLINVALDLGFYVDFTEPLKPGLALNLWVLLAQVAQALVGAELRDDPVWLLLARLAGEDWSTYPPPERQEAGEIGLLDALTAQVRARLAEALAFEPAEERAMIDLVLRHDARILLSRTRLDVFFSIDTLPVEIRRSGLDRDPGWVPAAGLVVAFHFE